MTKSVKLFSMTNVSASLLSLRLKGEKTLKWPCVCWPRVEKFDIVSNDHGRTQNYSFSVLDQKYPFCLFLVQNVKTDILRWNLVSRLIQIWRIQWQCSPFLILTGNTLFGQIRSLKSKLLAQTVAWYLD